MEDEEFNRGIDSAQSKGKGFAASLGSGMLAAGKTIAKGVAVAVGAAASIVGMLGKIGFEYNSQMEDYTANFSVMLGGAEAGAQKVDELKKLAASTPFSMGDLAESTQTLLAFNVANEDSTGVLSMLATFH